MLTNKQSAPFEFNLIKRDANGDPIGRVQFIAERPKDLRKHFNNNGEMKRRS
jgi:hypothetical protein